MWTSEAWSPGAALFLLGFLLNLRFNETSWEKLSAVKVTCKKKSKPEPEPLTIIKLAICAFLSQSSNNLKFTQLITSIIPAEVSLGSQESLFNHPLLKDLASWLHPAKPQVCACEMTLLWGLRQPYLSPQEHRKSTWGGGAVLVAPTHRMPLSGQQTAM